MPDLGVPGVSRLRSAASRKEVETGITVSVETIGRNDALTVGATYLNVAYDLAATTYAGTAPSGAPILKTAIGAPIAHRSGFFAHEAYRVADSPLSIYADALFQYASATGSRYLDPRATIVYAPGARQAFRLSAGETTTQPAGNQLGQPFVPHLPGGAGGGAAITCAGLNSIGTTPSTVLKPERGVDEEFAYDRTFGGDSQAQLALYNVNVLDKLYSTLVPLTSTGAGFIDPAFLAAATQAVQASCGAAAASLLGLTGTFNVGTLRARGIALSGRQRLTRATFLDYDWSLDSTVLVSAPAPLLQSNLTLVPGSQLPSVPLHTLGAALEHVFPRGFDVRYGFHAVSANNTKNLPPYDFSDLRIGIPVRSAQLAVSIANLFNQYAFIQGYRYEGVPVALNAYATAASYAPVIGASATERFGLPARTLFLTLTLNR
ncbi:MAG: TonB-dependent receptor [Candidatus Eremiobacteraeota bacterium]|nr:TonB-dependent receptor [Candidatus Eremiobacteraeota bacterium]